MKIITATMAHNISNKMEGFPEVQAIMDDILLTSLKGKNCVIDIKGNVPTEIWESRLIFFAGLGYKVESFPLVDKPYARISW